MKTDILKDEHVKQAIDVVKDSIKKDVPRKSPPRAFQKDGTILDLINIMRSCRDKFFPIYMNQWLVINSAIRKLKKVTS